MTGTSKSDAFILIAIFKLKQNFARPVNAVGVCFAAAQACDKLS